MLCFIRFPIARILTRSMSLLACAAVLLKFAVASVQAAGTVTIQHNDGTVNTYDDVAIKIIHDALYLTSADGQGTIVINRAACSYQGQTLVCFPTGVTLVQSGSSKPVDLASGTIYANMTDEEQQLPLSSIKLPPHSILLSISTKRGTYINLSGAVDKVTK
jgi:hypothetical protein